MYEKEKEECSKILYAAARETWKNRQGILGEVDSLYSDFRGISTASLRGSNVFQIGFNPDGVGHKIEVAERLSEVRGDFSPHKTIAKDLFSMTCDDSACRYQEPIAVSTILEVNRPNIGLVKDLAEGMTEAARVSKVAVVGGEFAVAKRRVKGYGDFNYNWGGFAVGVFDKGSYQLNTPDHLQRKLQDIDYTMFARAVLNKDEAAKSDAKNFLVALQENGPRCNGYTDILEILENVHGQGWHQKNHEGRNLAEWFLEPSKIFAPLLVELTRESYKKDKKIYGLAHITGGGIPKKLAHVLRQAGNVGADIYDPCDPPESLLYIQKIGKMGDRAAYGTFGMGHGVIMVTENFDRVLSAAEKFGYDAKVVGKIIHEPVIRIRSKGHFSKGKNIDYLLE